jgi:predicted transport protein
VRELFEALRKEVLALDEQVSETFLKHWIAYKLDTNFVDVVPKAKGLRLSINMKYKEINDPEGMTEDISGKGRWGNGEVSVHFRNMADLPYIMSLVKQSLEKQKFQE